MSLGKNIKDIRKLKKISLTALSNDTGISRSTLTDIERDGDRKPNTTTLEKIANALDVNINDFYKNDLQTEYPEILSPELKDLVDTAKNLSSSQLEALKIVAKEFNKK